MGSKFNPKSDGRTDGEPDCTIIRTIWRGCIIMFWWTPSKNNAQFRTRNFSRTTKRYATIFVFAIFFNNTTSLIDLVSKCHQHALWVNSLQYIANQLLCTQRHGIIKNVSSALFTKETIVKSNQKLLSLFAFPTNMEAYINIMWPPNTPIPMMPYQQAPNQSNRISESSLFGLYLGRLERFNFLRTIFCRSNCSVSFLRFWSAETENICPKNLRWRTISSHDLFFK